jgi:hypothetical protein
VFLALRRRAEAAVESAGGLEDLLDRLMNGEGDPDGIVRALMLRL